MFDTLSSKLQNAFKNLRGLGKISEANVTESLREVRLALLDADVNFKVARDFIEKVASFSGTSGKPYLIRFKDGSETKSRDFLLADLKKIEKPIA